MSLKEKYFYFSLIVIVNVFIKSWYAGENPYTFDEMISVKDTLLDFGHIKHEAEWDNNPPFFYYCLWIWHKIVPINELNSRLFSVILVSLSIGFSFVFAQKYFNVKTAFFSIGFLTFSNFLMFYSMEVRTYSLILLLAVLSSLQFFKFIFSPSTINLVILSIINFLLIYSHYISGIILLLQYLIIILLHRKQFKFFFLVQTTIVIGLVLLRFTKKQFLNIVNFNGKKDFWLKTANFDDLISAFTRLFINKIFAVIFLSSIIIFLYFYFRKKTEGKLNVQLYCILLGFCSIFILFCIGTVKAVFLDRYLIFCVPFATMLFCYYLTYYKTFGYLLFTILFIVECFYFDMRKLPDMDYRAAAKLIDRLKKETDYVIINTKDNLNLFEYYYNRDQFFMKEANNKFSDQRIYGITDIGKLKDLSFEKGSKVFLIQSYHRIANPNNNLAKECLDLKLKEVHAMNFYNGIEFHIFKN